MNILLAASSCIILSTSMLTAEVKDNVVREAKPRFKGVEIYCWMNEESKWVFVLLNGTNRNKTKADLRLAKKRFIGLESVKKAIGGLAVGETVTMFDIFKQTQYPSQKMQEELAAVAKDLKINFFHQSMFDAVRDKR